MSERDAHILQLEQDVQELGAYNDELQAQLNGEGTAESEGTEAVPPNEHDLSEAIRIGKLILQPRISNEVVFTL